MKKIILLWLMMFLLVKSGDPTASRVIHDASNIKKWDMSKHTIFEIVEVHGDANLFPWPNGSASAALLTSGGHIVFNPNVKPSTRKEDRASGLAKLRALGLTQRELDVLIKK